MTAAERDGQIPVRVRAWTMTGSELSFDPISLDIPSGDCGCDDTSLVSVDSLPPHMFSSD